MGSGEKPALRHLLLTAILGLASLTPAQAQDPADQKLIGELLAFHGSRVIVSAMTTHCYETTGLDDTYKTAYDNWYLRNIGFLDLADRVVARLGGAPEGLKSQIENLAGSQIMSAYNQSSDRDVFCRGFLAEVDGGMRDINKQLPAVLEKAQEIASQ